MGLPEIMVFLDLGCGLGRDVFLLMNRLGPKGRHTGIDVTNDSIKWCQMNITPTDSRFNFRHVDAYSELYKPFGGKSTTNFSLPNEDGTGDGVGLASVFTHLLEDEGTHYMSDFRRILSPQGRVHASFFLHSEEALEAAKTLGETRWKAAFDIEVGPGVYVNEPQCPSSSFTYTNEAMQRMTPNARPVTRQQCVKGSWSGLHGDLAEEGQDAVILSLA